MKKHMQYVDIQGRWRRLGPLYRSPEAALVWWPEMEAYRHCKAVTYGHSYKPHIYDPALTPSSYECGDWRCSTGRRGRHPGYWDFTCSMACHWLCNLHLAVAMQAEPDRAWQIVSSGKHSTVWDGDQTIWDTTLLAMEICPNEAWELAALQTDSERLPPGELMLKEIPEEIEEPYLDLLLDLVDRQLA